MGHKIIHVSMLSEQIVITLFSSAYRFVSKDAIDNKSILVQVMAWCRTGDKPLPEPMWIGCLSPHAITRPQKVRGPSCICNTPQEMCTRFSPCCLVIVRCRSVLSISSRHDSMAFGLKPHTHVHNDTVVTTITAKKLHQHGGHVSWNTLYQYWLIFTCVTILGSHELRCP